MLPIKVVYFGDYVLVKDEILRKGEEIIRLPPKEIQLLTLLVENAGKVITKDEIVDKVWKQIGVSDESLARCICSLRKRLGCEKNNEYIITIYGKGYVFVKECTVGWEETTSTEAVVTPCVKEPGYVRRIKKTTYYHNYNFRLKNILSGAEQWLRSLLYNKTFCWEGACNTILSSIEKILLVDPFNAPALAIMGLLKTFKQDELTGHVYLLQARHLEPENNDIKFYHAWHLTMRGELDSAQAALARLRECRYVKFDVQFLQKIAEDFNNNFIKNKSRTFNLCAVKNVTRKTL